MIWISQFFFWKLINKKSSNLPLSISPWQPDWPGADLLLLMLSWRPGHFLGWLWWLFNPFCYLYLQEQNKTLKNNWINSLVSVRQWVTLLGRFFTYLVNLWLTSEQHAATNEFFRQTTFSNTLKFIILLNVIHTR